MLIWKHCTSSDIFIKPFYQLKFNKPYKFFFANNKTEKGQHLLWKAKVVMLPDPFRGMKAQKNSAQANAYANVPVLTRWCAPGTQRNNELKIAGHSRQRINQNRRVNAVNSCCLMRQNGWTTSRGLNHRVATPYHPIVWKNKGVWYYVGYHC